MPNRKTGKKQSSKSLGDITLNDFANSIVPKNRPKKSISDVVTALKNNVVEIELSWDEKTDDFDGEFVEQENEDGTTSYFIRKSEPRRRKKTVSTSEYCKSVEKRGGKDYPIDVWYILSEYIKPEDVGRFAGICKTSLNVVSSARFWFGLYKRFYISNNQLPEQLQPECMVRKYGLRTSVIRALHLMYPPFMNRVKAVTTFEHHPDVLKRKQCVLFWHRKLKSHWVYYFKMRDKIDWQLSHSRIKQHLPDLLEILDDVSANPDEQCRILQVTCLYCIQVPPVVGLTLTSVSLTLSQGLRHHRLQLEFASGINTTAKYSPDGTACTIILDPVINIKVLDWWHPQYPHNSNIQDLLSQDFAFHLNEKIEF